MSRSILRVLAVALCLSFAVASAGPAAERRKPTPKRATTTHKGSATAKRASARKKLTSIRSELRETKQDLRRTKQKQRLVSEQIREKQEGLETARTRLAATQSRLASAERSLADSRHRLAAAQARLARHVQLLRGRLVDVYKNGSASYVSVLLQSRDVWDLTSRGYLLQRVVQHDVTLVDAVKTEKAKVAAETERLRERRNEVARLRGAARSEVQVVGERLEEQREVQQALWRDRVRLEAALAELEQNSREVEAMLRAFEAQADIRQRIPRPWSGGFLRPVSGRITSSFGMRYHPVLHVRKLHTGVDFAAPTGTPIRAAGDGVVVHAGWWGGYGNCVVLAHGNGRSTLYGHCSSVSVSPGQQVKRGGVIGRVGSTGFSTGPHLHFEVRKNGVPVNPR